MTPSSPPPRRSASLAGAIAALLALVAAAATPWFEAVRAERSSPLGGAQWIWIGDARRERGPNGFALVRDFAVDSPLVDPRLAIRVEPEYRVYLDGVLVGSGAGSGRGGGAVDVWSLAGLLDLGPHRLAIEARTDTGAGGAIAAVIDRTTAGEVRTVVATDARFTVLRQVDAAALVGLTLLPKNAPAYPLGYPPVGRWGRLTLGPLEPPLAFSLAAPVDATLTAPARGHHALAIPTLESPGYLCLTLTPRGHPQLGLLRLGVGGVAAGEGGARPPLPIVIPAGSAQWCTTEAHSLRDAIIDGDLAIGRAFFASRRGAPPAPIGSRGAARPPAGSSNAGLLGLAPPLLRSPVEDEVGRQLERLAGVARREEL